MKKYLSIILIAFLTISLTSCATYITMNTNKWLEYELPPSRIVKNGEAFLEGDLSDGSIFSVFFDKKIDEDARYYHVILWQDFGWKLKEKHGRHIKVLEKESLVISTLILISKLQFIIIQTESIMFLK